MNLDVCHPQSWFLQHFLHKTLPTDFSRNCIRVCLQNLNYSSWKSEIKTCVQHQKYSFVVVQVTNLHVHTPVWVTWTNQLPFTPSNPHISFSLDKKAVPSRLRRGWVGWLFFLYNLILVTLQFLSLWRSQRACKKTQAQLPILQGALYHMNWICLEKSREQQLFCCLLALPKEHPTLQQHHKGWKNGRECNSAIWWWQPEP